MASYSASMIESNFFSGKLSRGCGSFANISIDGRLSLNAAIEVAREYFKKECAHNKEDYLGFAIEKTDRFLDYKRPEMIDTTMKAKDINFLL